MFFCRSWFCFLLLFKNHLINIIIFSVIFNRDVQYQGILSQPHWISPKLQKDCQRFNQKRLREFHQLGFTTTLSCVTRVKHEGLIQEAICTRSSKLITFLLLARAACSLTLHMHDGCYKSHVTHRAEDHDHATPLLHWIILHFNFQASSKYFAWK